MVDSPAFVVADDEHLEAVVFPEIRVALGVLLLQRFRLRLGQPGRDIEPLAVMAHRDAGLLRGAVARAQDEKAGHPPRADPSLVLQRSVDQRRRVRLRALGHNQLPRPAVGRQEKEQRETEARQEHSYPDISQIPFARLRRRAIRAP